MTLLKKPPIRHFILSASTAAIVSVFIFFVLRERLFADLDADLVNTAAEVSQSASFAPFFLPEDAPKTRGPSINPPEIFFAPGVYLQIWGQTGDKLTMQSASANIDAAEVSLDAAGLDLSQQQYRTVDFEGKSLRVYTRPIIVDGRQIASIQVAGNLSIIDQTLDWLQRLIILNYLFIITYAGLAGLWYSRKLHKPIQDITQAVSDITATDDLGIRLDWNGSAQEMGQLTRVFNQMMARIEHLFTLQQRFIEDISHELRTPLTSIQGNVEIARRYGLDMLSIEAIEVESRRLTQLVEDMLLLARADSGSLHFDLYPLDLDKIVTTVVTECAKKEENRRLNIRIRNCVAVCIDGNVDRIKELVAHLINNAVKFTPDGGQVMVNLERTKEQAILSVTDTGIGLSPTDIERIFERFYQVDTARTYTDGSFGLGLPISRWIVQEHGGTIEVSSQPGEGATFTVKLPRHDALKDAEGKRTTRNNIKKSTNDVKRITDELRIIRASKTSSSYCQD
jgi:two-component system, OmpR family, sensor kinase